MKCKRLCAWLLSLVMMFSLLPVSAAAKWYDKHSVTVKYEFKDDSSKSKPDDVKRTIASTEGAIIAFKVKEPGYNHSAKVTSGNAECSIDAGFLHVKHVDADSVITVTYTPKDNVITIDQYYNNGTILAKWGTNITVNGLDIVENNKLEKGAIIDNHDLTAAMEDYRFLTVDGKTYDFSYARQIPYPGESSDIKLAKVWYERDTGEWYYSHLGNTKVPLANKSGVNFCYNTVHTENSKHHDFEVVRTVLPTCTKGGYTVYKCAYCDYTEQRETAALGHAWSAWTHDDATSGADSMHTHTCMRKGCNETERSQCNFTISGTDHICNDCKYTYVDYTLTYDANGGKWSAAPSGYTMNEGNTTATIKGLASSTKVGAAPAPANGNMAFKGWSSSTDAKDIVVKLALSPTVGNLMHDYDTDEDNTVTFYAIWEDSGEQPELTYTIRQHFMRNDGPKGEDGAVNYIELGQAAKGTMISTLINDLEKGWKFGSPSQTYLYDSRKTKVNDVSDVAATSKLETSGTVIDLYYYLDENEDQIPDYTQIFISYQSGNLLYGTVRPEKKVVITLNDSNKKGVIVTDDAQGGTATPRENYAFDKWVKGSDGNAAAYSKNTTLMPTITDPIGGTTYVFTAFFKPAGQDMGTLNVTKVMTGKNLADLPDNFALLVKNAQDVTVATLMLHGDNNKTVYVSDDGHWSLDLTPGDYTIEEVSADIDGYDLTTTYTQKQNTVSAGATTSVTVTNSYMERGADLVDDAITIYHKVSDRSDWHGGNAYADASAHQAGRTPTISYKAELDLSKMELQMNKQTASIIAAYGEKPWENLVEAVKAARGSLAMFSGSKIVLHVQLDKQLSTADIQNQLNLNNIKVTSDWFELSNAGNPVVYDEKAQSLTITCVPKIKAEGYSSTITLSGLNNLSLTSILSSGETRTLIASGYITGSILISVPTVKVNAVTVETEDLVDAVQHGNGELYLNESIPLVLGSKTATNTAKLYWKEIKDNDDDDDDKYFFAIQKVDAQDGHALNGAKFELYQLDKNDRIKNRRVVRTTQQSSKNGIALFGVDNKNSYDGIWYYAEVSAPEGYVLDNTEHKIKATDFSDSLSTAVSDADIVRNYRGTTPDLLNDSDHFAYVIGYMDGNVRPYGLISRAETTTIFFRLLKDSVRDGNLLTSNTYTDVADDYWANTAISTMARLGVINGRNSGLFDPDANITRAEFAAICARFDDSGVAGVTTFTDTADHWAEDEISRAAALGWIQGYSDDSFRPDQYISRAQAVTMINRVLCRLPEDTDDLLSGMNTWTDCHESDWFYLAIQEATNSHDFVTKDRVYESWTDLNRAPDWSRYE